MALMKIKCPRCATEGSVSLADEHYEGPYACWKCHEFCSIEIDKGQLVSCQPASKEEVQKMQEAKALKDRFTRRP